MSVCPIRRESVRGIVRTKTQARRRAARRALTVGREPSAARVAVPPRLCVVRIPSLGALGEAPRATGRPRAAPLSGRTSSSLSLIAPAALGVEELAEAILDPLVLRAVDRRAPRLRSPRSAARAAWSSVSRRIGTNSAGMREPHHLVERVVADRRHGAVEGRVVAAHGIGRAQVDDALRDVRAGRRSPRTRPRPARRRPSEGAQAARRSRPPPRGPGRAARRIVGLPGSRPSSRSASARGRSSASSRNTIGGTSCASSRRELVGPASAVGREVPGLEDRVEEVAAGERSRARPGLPQPAAAPDRRRARASSRRAAGRRAGCRRRRGGPARPRRSRRAGGRSCAATSAGRCPTRGAAVRRHVLDREPHLAHHRAPPSRASRRAAPISRSSRLAIAIERVRWPRPVPFDDTNMIREPAISPASRTTPGAGPPRDFPLRRAHSGPAHNAERTARRPDPVHTCASVHVRSPQGRVAAGRSIRVDRPPSRPRPSSSPCTRSRRRRTPARPG